MSITTIITSNLHIPPYLRNVEICGVQITRKCKTLPQIFIITHETKQSYKLPFLKKRFSKNLFPASTEWEGRENYELSTKLTLSSVIASVNRYRWYNSKELQNSFLSFYRYFWVYCENALIVH